MPPEVAGPVIGWRIEPLEPLLFGDNRPARAGLDHLQADQDPSPLTVYGAIGRLLAGDDDSPWPESLLGPFQDDVLHPSAPVAELLGWCLEDAAGGPLFPRPLHLRCRRRWGGGLATLAPLAPEGLGGARTSAGSPSLALADDEQDEHEGGVWLDEDALAEALTGGTPRAGLYPGDEVYRAEPRPGIAIDNDRGTVIEGYFFTRPYRRLRPAELDPARTSGPGIRAWFRTLEPPAAPPEGRSLGFLGGDRRRARFEPVESLGGRAEIFAALRRRIERAAPASRGLLLYLLTPAVAEGEPLPRPKGLGPPVAAAVGKPRWTSGWNVRQRRPRELVALIPEGSVLFFEWPEGADRAELVRERWLAPVGEAGAAAGFGRSLVGVW